MDKKGIRNLGKLLRKEGTADGFENAAYAFLSKLTGYRKASLVMLYLSLPDEAPTDRLIKMVLSDGKRVCVPVTEGRVITPCEISEGEELSEGAFSVREPLIKRAVCKEKIDICVVPGLLFDKRGTRCGYGKGCYDTFLETINPLKVGLAFSSQVVTAFPSEAHDVKMNYIITEKEVIDCGEKI